MRGLTICILACVTYALPAQVNTDSLLSVWENIEVSDELRLEAINSLAWDGYLFSKPDSAYYYAQQHFEFANANGYVKESGIARNTQATALYMLGNYDKALKLYYESLEIKKSIRDTISIAVGLNNIGMLYDEQGLNQEAIAKYEESIGLLSIIQLKDEAKAQKTLGASYQNLGVIYTDDNPDLALDYLFKALEIAEEYSLERDKAYAYNNIANIYSDKGDKSKALQYYESAFTTLQKLGDKQGTIDALINLGIYYLETNNYQEAIRYANQVLERLNAYGSLTGARDANELLYECYKAMDDTSKALSYYESHITFRDSVETELKKEEVIKQVYQYNYENQAAADSAAFAASEQLKNDQIADQQNQLKAESTKQLLLTIILIMIALLCAIIFIGYKRLSKASKVISEQKLEVEAQRDQLSEQHQMLADKNLEIVAFNENLEKLVKERTSELEESIDQIRKYQHDLAHNIRAPYVTMMGLIKLIKDGHFDSEENKKVIEALRTTGEKMEAVLKSISKELNDSDKSPKK